MQRTHEGANVHEHSLNHALEFFSKAGSLFTKRGSFYGGEESALGLFQKVWIVDKELAFKLLLHLRDCRGGSGNRSATREIYTWLAENTEDGKFWIMENIDWLPLVGRWDDLRSLLTTQIGGAVARYWASALEENVLAAKWADRGDTLLRMQLGMKIGDFRRYLAKKRKDHIVEHKMSTNRWKEVEYKTVPSIAMARYTNAFKKHDEERFTEYKESLKKGEETIHAGVLFPHDCVRTVLNGDSEIADAQFDAMPNFLEGTDEKIITICDTSGSMCTPVSGSVEAIHISQGMALYCSAKIPENNPFYKKFIAFCSESEFKNWNGIAFSKAINNPEIFDQAVGATRIDTALDLILSTAKNWNLTQDQIPTMLLIVSDMQFHRGGGCITTDTEIERCLKKWDDAGYKRPKIVYWNLAGYGGSQDVASSKSVGLVSGFSPAILTSILSGESFDPISIMYHAIEKYSIKKVG